MPFRTSRHTSSHQALCCCCSTSPLSRTFVSYHSYCQLLYKRVALSYHSPAQRQQIAIVCRRTRIKRDRSDDTGTSRRQQESHSSRRHAAATSIRQACIVAPTRQSTLQASSPASSAYPLSPTFHHSSSYRRSFYDQQAIRLPETVISSARTRYSIL